MHYHMTVGEFYAAQWETIDKLYRTIMRDPDRINYVTLLRDPREHLISYYYYFLERKHKVGETSLNSTKRVRTPIYLCLRDRVNRFSKRAPAPPSQAHSWLPSLRHRLHRWRVRLWLSRLFSSSFCAGFMRRPVQRCCHCVVILNHFCFE